MLRFNMVLITKLFAFFRDDCVVFFHCAEVDVKEKSFTVLVTLEASCGTEGIIPAVRQLQVGCINPTPPSKKVR